MRLRFWSPATLFAAWVGALALVLLSQLLSALVMPRAWEFFWLLPVDDWRLASAVGFVGRLWLGVWRERPFEAFSLTVVALLLAFTLGWLTGQVVRLGWHVAVGRRAVDVAPRPTTGRGAPR